MANPQKMQSLILCISQAGEPVFFVQNIGFNALFLLTMVFGFQDD
jgi:hypothetical protein